MLKKIFIENLTCSASVGVYENEKLNKQKIKCITIAYTKVRLQIVKKYLKKG